MNLKQFFSLCLLIAILSSCGKVKPTPTPIPTAVPTVLLPNSDNFETVECPFQIPPETGRKALCGYLTVPEDRINRTESPKIKIAVAVYKTPSTDPKPDPVLITIGTYPIMSFSFQFTYLFENIYANRDLVIADLRGTGYSQPSWDCPEFPTLFFDALANNLSAKERADRYLEANRACYNRVSASGVNLAAYNSTEMAADLEDLRLALGYRQWNILGIISTGTRLALTLMRDYPQGIRSVILDSVLPPQVDLYAEQAVNVEQAFNTLFQRCADDEQCNQAYPKLKEVFYEVLDQLYTKPVSLEVSDLQNGKRYKLMVDGDRLMDVMWIALDASFREDMIPEVPRMIYQIRDGKYEVLSRFLGIYAGSPPDSTGMEYWEACNEELRFTSLEIVNKANEKVDLRLREYFNTGTETAFEACAVWGGNEIPTVKKDPVVSDIHTLLLAGDYDWRTPPSWAKLAGEKLSSSYYVEFAGIGQVVSVSSMWSTCSHQILDAFLENPGVHPNTSCATEKKDFLWVTTP